MPVNVLITDGTTPSPDASSLLELNSTTKGLLLPRLTTVQRQAISSPSNGLLVYDTDVKCFMYYTTNNSIWNYLCNTGATGSNLLANTTTELPGSIDVKAGDVIKFDGMMFVRLTAGNNNDYFYFRIRISGCVNTTNDQIGYFHATEDGADHDNFKPIPISDFWQSTCNGQVNFSYQV